MRRTHPSLAMIVCLALGAAASQGCDVVAAPLDENAPHTRTVLEVDADNLRRTRLDTLADEMRDALRNAPPPIPARDAAGSPAVDVARVQVLNPADSDRALAVLAKGLSSFPAGDAEFARGESGQIEGRLTSAALSRATREVVNQSIGVIGRRVNPKGARNITVTAEGERIILRTPPSLDASVIPRLIGRTALMTFHLLREDADLAEAAQGRVPAGAVFAPFATSAGQEGGLVLEQRPRLTGQNLTNAQAGFDQIYNRPVVTFDFDDSGTKIFCEVSTANVDKRFAIVLDDRILTAPVIMEPICGGRGQISGNFKPEETQELALLLRAGALPAPLRIVEQRTVGAR